MSLEWKFLFAVASVVAVSVVARPGIPSAEVTTTVRVISPEGKPLSGMSVGLTYARVLESDDQESFSGETGETGEISFTGRAESDTHVSLRQPGYYGAYRKVSSYVVDRESGDVVFLDRTIELVAKEIRDPIVMVATRRNLYLPREYASGAGFDLMKNDFVEPLGSGLVADLYLSVDEELGETDFFETRLSIRFPNEGDGLAEFIADPSEGSALRSVHQAPSDGYEPGKTIVNGLYRIDDAGVGYPQREQRTIRRDDMNYYIRVRTKQDSEGRVVSAQYGKIYGDFALFGHRDPEKYTIKLGSCYYLNPTSNDRNVEAVSGSSLLEGVSRLDLPNSP